MLQQPRSQEETPCISTQNISWETLLNKGEKPSQILFYNIQEKYLYHQEYPSIEEGSQNPRNPSAQERCATLTKKCTC
jgi:hypothetical protein